MKEVKKIRLDYIDIAKAIALFFVVLGHLPLKGQVFDWIFSFHMPLFFILSGMTLNIDKYKNIFEYIKKKVKQLLIPFAIFMCLGLIITLIVKDWRANLTLHNLVFDLFYRTQPEIIHVGQIWFLMCLFMSSIMFYAVEKYIVKDKSKLFTAVVYILISILAYNILKITVIKDVISIPFNTSRLPFKIDSALMALVFIKIGHTITKYNVIEKVGKKSILKTIIILLALFFINGVTGMYLNKYVNICDCIYKSYINYLIAAITGSLFIILLSYKINKNRLLVFFGKNTLIMFAVHSLFIELTKYLISISPVSIDINSMYVSVGRTFVILAMLVPVTYLYNFIKKKIKKNEQ